MLDSDLFQSRGNLGVVREVLCVQKVSWPSQTSEPFTDVALESGQVSAAVTGCNLQ
jgi:hypothetical protein